MEFLKNFTDRFTRNRSRDSRLSSNKNNVYIGEPFDFKEKMSVKIDTKTNRLIGFPPEWETILKQHGIDTHLDPTCLPVIIRAYKRSFKQMG